MKHPTRRLSPWAVTPMTDDAWRLADRLNLIVVADSPRGPWKVRHPLLADSLEGMDVNALISSAAREVTNQ